MSYGKFDWKRFIEKKRNKAPAEVMRAHFCSGDDFNAEVRASLDAEGQVSDCIVYDMFIYEDTQDNDRVEAAISEFNERVVESEQSSTTKDRLVQVIVKLRRPGQPVRSDPRNEQAVRTQVGFARMCSVAFAHLSANAEVSYANVKSIHVAFYRPKEFTNE